MDIAQIILTQRMAQNLSQRALAQKAGIRQATLSAVECGGEIKLLTAQNILFALGLDFDIVQRRQEKPGALAQRAAEIKRLRRHVLKRRGELQLLLSALSAQQFEHVREINQQTNTGYLATLWDDFLRLNRSEMHAALDADRFNGMAWQSLLQANPFIVAGVGSWA